MKACPRCELGYEQDGGYCRRCGTALLDRICLVCGEPLFGPELLHLASLLLGGPRVL